MTTPQAPLRCTACSGSGNGQTVVGERTHVERCSTCAGAGRVFAAAFVQRGAVQPWDTALVRMLIALNGRVLIEQAEGVLSERLGIGVSEASAALRGAARARDRRLSDFAKAVVEGSEDVQAAPDVRSL